MIRPAEAAECMPLFEKAAGDDRQRRGIAEIVRDAQLFRVGGLALALKICGVELWIQAAGGNDPARDMTADGLEVCETLARENGLDSVGFQTRRPGLVRKALRHGYEIDGFILRKKIK